MGVRLGGEMGVILKEMLLEMECHQYRYDTGWGMILKWEVRQLEMWDRMGGSLGWNAISIGMIQDGE